MHIHHGEDEPIYVLEGEVTFQIGEQRVASGPGTLSLIPQRTSHTHANLGYQSARILMLFSPPGLERYWERTQEVWRQALASGHDPDAATLAQLGVEFRLELVGPALTSRDCELP